MKDYDVTVEVEGVVHITVTEADEDAASRRARLLVELGQGTPNLDYGVVKCVEATT